MWRERWQHRACQDEHHRQDVPTRTFENRALAKLSECGRINVGSWVV